MERLEVAPVSRDFVPEPEPEPAPAPAPAPANEPAPAPPLPTPAPAAAAAVAVSPVQEPEEEEPLPEPDEPPASYGASPRERWRAAVEAVKAAHPRHGKSLAFGRLVALRPAEAVLAFPKESGFHRATVNGSGKANIEKALLEHFGRAIRLVDDPSEAACGSAPASFAEEESRERASREKGIEAKVRNHPAVRSALRILGGELEHVQVLEQEPASAPEPDLPDEGA